MKNRVKTVVLPHFSVYNLIGGTMKVQTHLGDTLEAMEALRARYDKNVKELLADIQVLARIVKHTVSEVEKQSVEEIMNCIDVSSIRIGAVPTAPGLTNMKKVESIGAEDSILNEGYITYDIRFLLIVEAAVLEIIINVEAQKSTDFRKLGYHIESRIVYYLARLISSQKGIDFTKSEYDKIKKFTVSGYAWTQMTMRIPSAVFR